MNVVDQEDCVTVWQKTASAIGFTGLSILHRLHSLFQFEVIRVMVFYVMHTLLLVLVKRHLELYKEKGFLNDAVKKRLDAMLSQGRCHQCGWCSFNRTTFWPSKTKWTIFARLVILMQSAGRTRLSFTNCTTDGLHMSVGVFNRTIFWPSGRIEIWWCRTCALECRSCLYHDVAVHWAWDLISNWKPVYALYVLTCHILVPYNSILEVSGN